MKPIVEKLTLSENTSFLARTYRTPLFEVPWHQHIEYELIMFKEGEGSSFIGNYVGEFKTGDIFFLGSNLPHTFQKANKELITSALVIQFRDDFWGKDFLQLPESRNIKQLLDISYQGLKITGNLKEQLRPFVEELEFAEGFERIILLCECLQMIMYNKEYETVSTQEVKAYNTKHKERIDKIYQYTIDYFQDAVTLDNVAAHAGMSVPAFCNYFKKSTKKTYIDFLNEVRIGYACKQLIDTQKTIEAICYESGFNTLANFNKQFLKVKQVTPSRYRKDFMQRM
ncbi:helix-turn-helix domain-containing protein [Panacibacter ginsenosidivorans]|uniref:Helix-turn-helix domain-containing protein n=1 Tax=Panacibacter ginsenosidivorans TaxID=1813871 RepID=A0A5B8V376_9BACT|nr:AraC family transcriptional regulator [Panacibacter ginsenosidivorans]QEC65814.1 helix-turn-helix domain-containing protein [Panacibacter ginsenosidivorans]